MRYRAGIAVALVCGAFAGSHAAQEPSPAKVDFGRDVQPIFRQCIGCHGPTIHQNGFRLDRRSDAMRGGTFAMIGPGNSEGSRLYRRLIGSEFGSQMPPTGALKPDQIAIVKAWIDQGAIWPDELANEAPPAPINPATTRLLEAALEGRTALVERMLRAGADPNGRNEAGATALMRAVDSAETTRVLLEWGADPNAKADEGRTPLIMAAGRFGSAPVVKLLLDYGADPTGQAPGFGGNITALIAAAYRGDAAMLRLLLQGAPPSKDAVVLGTALSLFSHCTDCFNLMAPALDARTSADVANTLMPPDDNGTKIGPLLARGVDPKTADPAGRTLLIRAAASDDLPIDIVNTLIERGADVNATSSKGDTAIGLASMRGHTPMVDLLMKAGAHPAPAVAPKPTPSPAATPAAAIARSLPLLQQNDVTFLKKSGCVSCHNNSITAMAVATVRARRLPVNEEVAGSQLRAIGAYMDSWRERALEDIGIPGDSDTISYIMLGLAAEHYAANDTTAAMARFLMRQQTPDGQWRIVAHRPPIESSDIQVTAVSMRALQVYAPPTQRSEYDAAVSRAAAWLRRAQPRSIEDRTFQLLGLAWAQAPKGEIQRAGEALIAQQRADGGWAQLPTLDSDAYATGQALTALAESGALTSASPAYARGVSFLLQSQLADGSWFVATRALPIQPHFESGFPHGRNQFISAAATGWATIALARSGR